VDERSRVSVVASRGGAAIGEGGVRRGGGCGDWRGGVRRGGGAAAARRVLAARARLLLL
jgi:hypothetical protein